MLRNLKRAKYRKRDAAQPETREMPEKRRCADEKEKAKQLPKTAGHCALSMEIKNGYKRNSAAFVCGDGEDQKLRQQPDPGYLK